MTIRRFRRLVARSSFTQLHYEHLGFGGRAYRMGRSLRHLARVPGLDELFTRAVFCVLEKPA
jgi:hypothetical protein